jgi:hypothetical protein
MWPIGWTPQSSYTRDKRWRSCVAIKANPLRGGHAKPKGLLCMMEGSQAVERRRWGDTAQPSEKGGGCGYNLTSHSVTSG